MKAKKVFHNIVASFLSQIVNIVVNIILPPLIIMAYGSKVNGLVSSIKQLMSYISLVGAGISIATTQALYKPLAENDKVITSGMMNAANKMFTKAGSIFSFLAIIFAFVYPLLIDGEMGYFTIVKLVIVMSIVGSSEFFVVGKFRSLLYADQRSYVFSLIQAAAFLLSFICTFVFIKLEMSIVLVQFAASFAYIIRIAALYIYIKKNYGYLDSKVEPIQTVVAKKNDAFIHQLTGLVTLGSQTIILSTFTNLEIASIYAVYNVVFSGFQSICSQVVNSISPFFGRNIALSESEVLRKEFNSFEFLYSFSISFLYSVCTVMIVPFISVYIGRDSDINYMNNIVAYLFVIVSFFTNIRLLSQSVISVAGHFKETRSRALIEATLCIVLQLILVKRFGIYGVLIGSAIALGWRCIDILLYANKYIIKQKNHLTILRLLKAPIATILMIIINFSFHMSIKNFYDWIIWASINSLLSLVIVFLVNLVLERKKTIYYVDLLKKFIFGKIKIQ